MRWPRFARFVVLVYSWIVCAFLLALALMWLGQIETVRRKAILRDEGYCVVSSRDPKRPTIGPPDNSIQVDAQFLMYLPCTEKAKLNSPRVNGD